METTWHTSQPHPWECPKPCLCVMAKLKEEALEFAESYKGNCSFPLGSICVSNVQHSTAIKKFSETTRAFQHGS